MNKYVIKSDGSKEIFDEEKFCKNLSRLGLDEELSLKICKEIINKLPNEIKSKDLHKLTFEQLKKINLALATKYNLKKAFYKLGPTGYPFERYIGKVLSYYGFDTFINVWLDGKCTSYETDILAIKGEEKFAIECKYHHTQGIKSDLKTVLYVFGRYIDIRERYPEIKAWLITNTKITQEGINFAECRGIKITAWKYPKNESLENLIEEKALYPVTILIRGNNFIFKKLIDAGIVLLQDFVLYSIEEIAQKSNLDLKQIKKLKEEVDIFLSFIKSQ